MKKKIVVLLYNDGFYMKYGKRDFVEVTEASIFNYINFKSLIKSTLEVRPATKKETVDIKKYLNLKEPTSFYFGRTGGERC